MMVSFRKCNSPSQCILPSCLRFPVSVQDPRFGQFVFQYFKSMIVSVHNFSPVHSHAQVQQAAYIPTSVLCSVWTSRFYVSFTICLGGKWVFSYFNIQLMSSFKVSSPSSRRLSGFLRVSWPRCTFGSLLWNTALMPVYSQAINSCLLVCGALAESFHMLGWHFSSASWPHPTAR